MQRRMARELSAYLADLDPTRITRSDAYVRQCCLQQGLRPWKHAHVDHASGEVVAWHRLEGGEPSRIPIGPVVGSCTSP